MGKRIPKQRQSSHHRRRPRPQSRRSRKQSTLGLRILLIVALLALAGWILVQVPPGFLIVGGITVLVVILLCIIVWFILRYRFTPEEQLWYEEQRMEAVRMEETAQAIGVRSIERKDLAHLTHEEFEYFAGALLEAMGVLFEWEKVGGARDHGIDLRGKNQNGLPLVVQCKHLFSGKVTPDMTRDFGWALGLHSADEAWFVTTASFTEQARADVEKLTRKGYMKLVDGEQLMEYLWDHWNGLPAQWQWRLTECALKSDQ